MVKTWLKNGYYESNEIIIDNLIKAQDEVDFMAEKTTKIFEFTN